MSRRPVDLTKLLRWHPVQWRERYGDELVALMEDSLHDRRPSLQLRVTTVWSGLREHGYQTGLIGDQRSAALRLRAGSLLILSSWTAFMLAGASFSKLSEHFSGAMPLGSSGPAQAAFDVVSTLGVAGITVVLIGAGVAMPPIVVYLRLHRWTAIRRPAIAAMTSSLFTASAALTVGLWAHHFSTAQRNGGSALYSLVIVILALSAAVTLSLWTRVVTAIATLVAFDRLILRCEAVLACVLVGS
jgi:hypothetical protein